MPSSARAASASAGESGDIMPMWSHGDELLKDHTVICMSALSMDGRALHANFLNANPITLAASMCSGFDGAGPEAAVDGALTR